MMKTFLLALAVLVASARILSAEEARPPVLAGVGVSSLISIPIDDFGGPHQTRAADFRLTIPVSERFSMEGVLTLGRRADDTFEQLEGVYAIQVKQAIARAARGGFRPFLTYGALGYFERGHYDSYTFTRRDGTPVTQPGRSYGAVVPPALAIVGGGVQQQLGERFALRADAQLVTFLWIPLGTRFSTSLSVPIGRR